MSVKKTKSSSIKDLIFGADDRPLEAVEVPEWGLTVYVGPMSARDRDRLEAEMLDFHKNGAKDNNYRAKLLVKSLYDQDGNLIFSSEESEQLGNKSVKVLEKLVSVARKLNGLSADEEGN